MAILGLVGSIGTAAVYYFGGRSVISGTITAGTLVALAALTVRIYEPLTSLTNARVDVMTAFVSFERVFEVLDTPNPIQDRPDAIRARPGRRAHRVRPRDVPLPDVGRHRRLARGRLRARSGAGDHDVLDDITACIEPGQMVALVGPSGAGKSTLSSLVTRLYDVDARRDPHRRPRRPRRHPGVAARRDRHRRPGPAPVPHDRRREPPLRPARRHRRRAARRVQGGAGARRHRAPARRVRHRRRRAGLPALGRREAAPRHRPHAAEGPARS